MSENKKILITIGDVAGIGPEIVIKALNSVKTGIEYEDILIVGNADIFYRTALELGLPVPRGIEVVDIPLDISRLNYGEPSRETGKHSLLSLKKACELARENLANAIVTAPISKKSLNMAGFHYSGQTEILKDFLGSGFLYKHFEESRQSCTTLKNSIKNLFSKFKNKNKLYGPEMLFVAENLRVMLLTRHIKLSDISQNLNLEKILATIITLKLSLEFDFGIREPQIALCGLNPHAGENGVFGLEEEYFLKPAVKQLREKYSVNIEGPFPADSLWAKVAKSYMAGDVPEYDAYIACYHDQGLIPVKMLAMDYAVNTTINLPVIRTSPGHGTAYDIAGKNKADYRSMIESIKLADKLSSGKELKLNREKVEVMEYTDS